MLEIGKIRMEQWLPDSKHTWGAFSLGPVISGPTAPSDWFFQWQMSQRVPEGADLNDTKLFQMHVNPVPEGCNETRTTTHPTSPFG